MSLVQNSRLERVSTRSLLNGLSRYRGAAPALLLLLGLLGTGQITALALIPSVLLLLCLWGANSLPASPRLIAPLQSAVIFLLCLGFFSHSWPGFNNVEIWQQQFAPESISHSFYWNWDKLFVAVALLPWLLLRDGRSHSGPEFGRRQPLGLLLAIFALTIALSFAAAFALGLIEWQSKWGLIEQQWPQLLLFALSMLVIVVTAEECVFRGMLQHCACRYLSAWGVLIISGLFFGAVHVGFSPLFAIVAAVAGLGYGAIYYFSASILWSIALHFGLNVIHFLFFSYPMLALG